MLLAETSQSRPKRKKKKNKNSRPKKDLKETKYRGWGEVSSEKGKDISSPTGRNGVGDAFHKGSKKIKGGGQRTSSFLKRGGVC